MQRTLLFSFKDSGLEPLPAALNELLRKDAFHVSERKKIAQESEPSYILPDGFAIPIALYKTLYGEQQPVWNYKSTESKESKETINAPLYKEQLILLIDAIKKWGEENHSQTSKQRINDEILENLETFKENFFQPDYSGKQTSHFFITVKLNLEKIWYALTKGNATEAKKISELQELCEKIGLCNSGVYTYICDTAIQLTKGNTLEFLLAEMRKNITDAYARAHRERNKAQISIGSEVHISTALYSYSEDEGWGPLIDITKIREQYGERLTLVDDKVLLNFHEYFERSYNPKAILECIYVHFISELANLKNLLSIKEDKDGGMDYSLEFYEKTIQLAKSIGCEWSDLFDRSDTNKIYFNSKLFKFKFLKVCYEKVLLFQPAQWRTTELAEGFKIHSFCNLMSWVDTPDQTVFDWQNLPEKCDHVKLFISLRECCDAKLMPEAEYAKLIPKVIQTGEDLSRLLAKPKGQKEQKDKEQKEEKRISELLDFIGVQQLYTIAKNDRNFFKHIKVDVRVSPGVSTYYSILYEAIKQGNVATLKFLFNEGKLSRAYTFYDGFTIAHVAAKNGQTEIIRALAEYKGANLNIHNNFNQPPIDVAIQHKQWDTVNELLKHVSAWEPLYNAVRTENIKHLEKFLELKVDLSIENNNETLASFAAHYGRFNVLNFLFKSKIDINKEDMNGITPAHVATGHCSREALLQLKNSTDYKMDFFKPNSKGVSPLQYALTQKQWHAVGAILDLAERSSYRELLIDAITKGNSEAIKYLIPHLYLELDNENKTPMIFIAMEFRNTEAIHLLIKRGINLDAKKCTENTNSRITKESLADYAIGLNSPNVVQALLEHKIDFTKRDSNGASPLGHAIHQKHWEIVCLILQLKAPTAEEKDIPLPHLLVQRGDIEGIKALDPDYYDIDFPDAQGNTPAHYALTSRAMVEALRILKYSFVNPNNLDQTPLTQALEQKDSEIAATMLDLYPLSEDEKTMSLMQVAVLRENYYAIECLNRNSITDGQGNSILHLAVMFDKPKLIESLLRYSLDYFSYFRIQENSMLTHEADVAFEKTNQSGETAFSLAIEKKNWEIVAALFKVKLSKNETIFHTLVRERIPKGIAMLAKHKVQFDQIDEYGMTPFQLAIKLKELTGLKVLFDLNASLNIVSKDGKSAIDYAIESEDLRIIKFLAENGVQFTDKDIIKAANLRNADIAAFMLKLPSCHTTLSLAHLAAKANDVGVITKLQELKIDLESNRSHQNPADLAASLGHVDAFNKLAELKAIQNKPHAYYADIAAVNSRTDMVCAFANSGIAFNAAMKNPSFGVTVLLNLKNAAVINTDTLKEINKHRIALTAAFIQHVKKCKSIPEKEAMVKALRMKENALGQILGAPVNPRLFKLSTKQYNGITVTGSMYKILKECESLLNEKSSELEKKLERKS